MKKQILVSLLASKKTDSYIGLSYTCRASNLDKTDTACQTLLDYDLLKRLPFSGITHFGSGLCATTPGGEKTYNPFLA